MNNMGKELNAIRISDTIEKVHIDFSSIDSLYESSGFKRLYTIHTAETNKMTAKLGFHVGGFCDDRGSGGPDLAAEISGYDHLPSDLILCLMGDKYNFLPLDAKRLESLYVYLTTGKIISSTATDSMQAFFDKHHINPILPEFGIAPEVLIPSTSESDCLVLVYDFDLSKKTDSDAIHLGEQLFHYSDKLVNKFTHVGDALLSPDEDYYLLNRHDNKTGLYIVLIQAIHEKGQEQYLTRLLDTVIATLHDDEEEEVVEDTIEESVDEDVDDEDTLVDYVLFFKVDAQWPKSKDDFKTHYEFCYPLYLEKKPLFPYFSTLFEVEGIDRIHNTVSLVINRGKGEEHIQIKVGEEFAFDFAYQAQPNKRTYREGHAVLSLKHFNFGDDSVSGKLAVENSFVTDNEASVDQTLYLENITVNSEEEITADLDSGDSYGIFMIDEESKFILCYGLRFNADDEAEEFFVPVWFDKPNEEYISYNEKRHFNEMINRITYKK